MKYKQVWPRKKNEENLNENSKRFSLPDSKNNPTTKYTNCFISKIDFKQRKPYNLCTFLFNV